MTGTRVIVVVLNAAFALSCSDAPRTPSAPTPVPPVTTTPTYAVSGTIRDDADRPLSGVQVGVGQLFSKFGPRFQTTTDDMGRYAGRLPIGSHTLSATKPGFRPLSGAAVVVSGDTIFDATLRPGVIVSGLVNELGADRLTDVKIEILTGPHARQSAMSGHIPGTRDYSFGYLTPGQFRMRASKEGFDTVERDVTATVDTTVNFTLRWAYGSCLQSVAPVFLDQYGSAGGAETVRVEANAGRMWTATPDVPWLTVTSAASHTSSAALTFRVEPNPLGATEPRRGSVMIRCSASEAQRIHVVQRPDCQARLTAGPDTPEAYGPAGGQGFLRLAIGVPLCEWKYESRVEWITTAGVSSWRGEFSSHLGFIVRPNTTGVTRTGQLVVGNAVWSVTQR